MKNITEEEKKRLFAEWFKRIEQHPGNQEQYNVEHAETLPDSPLKGKTIIFLGSSVTVGAASKEQSFVEDFAKIDGVIPVKEAVSGTTLAWDEEGKQTYIERMLTIDKNIKADAFICQLSTNDATKGKKLGSVSGSKDREQFDTSTAVGAMEYIISYAYDTWHCPVFFYTGTKFDGPRYEEMIKDLYELNDKWNAGVIDLWDNEHMNAATEEEKELYMNDPIHPTRAGYLTWWYPEMKKQLLEQL